MLRALSYIMGHGSSSREQTAQGRRSAKPPSQELADIRPKGEQGVAINGSVVDSHPHRGYSPSIEDMDNVAGQQSTPGTRNQTPVMPKHEPTYVETAHTSEHREGRRSSQRSRRYREQMQSLKEENATFQTLVKTTQGDLMNAVNRSDNLQRQVKQLNGEKDTWFSEKSQMMAKERAKDKEVRELEETKRRQEGEIRRLQEKLRRSDERNNQLEKLLDVRTADLKGAQVFLTTADAYSGADILKMVEGLNAEIFQGAAFMAELLEDDAMMAGSEERVKNYLEFKRRENKPTFQIGNTLLDYLVANREQLRADPLPLQLAFQAFLTWWCVYMTERFFGGDAGREIQKVYQRIRDTEAQSIAGRWRAIAFANSKLFTNETYVDYVVETLLSLLGLCGWTRSGQKSQKAILSIQAIVMNIGKLWGQLKNATKEDVTTVDMQVFNYDPRTVYDVGLMEDTYGEIETLGPQPRRGVNSKPKDRILCTIGLGLRRSLVKQSEDGKPYEQIEVSLKPKVALVSVLALAGPAASSDNAKPTAQDGGGG